MKEKIPESRRDFLIRDFGRGFIGYCELRGEPVKKGVFRSEVRIGEHHRQQDGFIHAGVMATMADHTAGYAAFTTVAEEYQILTIEFKINFLRPAYGERLFCRSEIIREGGKILIGESDVFDCRDGNEVPVAKALVTLMSVHKETLISKG